MLSRVAEHLYWMARYVERSDNTARLLKATSQQILDARLPADWRVPIDILGANTRFDQDKRPATEQAVVGFLIADATHPGSIHANVRSARENARTVRELLPTEAWETINALHRLLRGAETATTSRRLYMDLLRRISDINHHFNGIIEGNLSRGPAYHFIHLAQLLERADMITRLLDSHVEAGSSTDSAWINLLNSLGGYLMYRQRMHARLNANTVTAFLMLDADYPRSVMFCLKQMAQSLLALPRSDALLSQLQQLESGHFQAAPDRMPPDTLHDYIDTLQMSLAELHHAIARQYFPEPARC